MPQEFTPMIKTENLNVVYNKGTSNEFWALQGINISVFPREYIIFFGPSGCGKSTLLNSIAGLETHTIGKVVVENRDISTLSEDELAAFHRASIGMIFQVYNLISSLSVIDNVILPQMFLNAGREARTKKATELLEKFGILEQAQKIPTELSGGQQQRIGIARALINNPKILLADEPVGNLDSASSLTVMDLLKTLNKNEGKTLIVVTHNPEHLFYANRIFYLKDGRIIREVINNEIRPMEAKKQEAENKPETTEEKMKKEFELLSRSFPGLTSAQINMLLVPFKAKMLTNYLLSSFGVDEINRIEQIVSDRISGRIDKEELMFKLDRDYEKGGAGLNSKTAERLAKLIEDVVNKKSLIMADNEAVGGNGSVPKSRPDFNSIWSQITELRKGFIDPMNKVLNDRQIMRMETAIYNRIIGDFDRTSFNEMLDRPFDKGGVGLNKATAKKISRDLEMTMMLSYGLK